MKKSLLVSICLPIYNGQKYLVEVLDSIVSQSFQDFEVVISDDNSTDDSLQIVRNHRIFNSHQVTIVKNEKRGIGRNWNNSIFHANGKFIKLIFQDDLLHHECLEDMLSHHKEGVSMVWSRKALIGDVQEGRQEHEDAVFRSTANKTKNEIFRDPKLYEHPRNPFGEPICSFFKKSDWENCRFDEVLRQGLDYEHAYRMLRLGRFVFIDKALVSFRLHEEQTTAVNIKIYIKDQYLLPAKLLGAHFRLLHPVVTVQLFQKLVTGWILFNFTKRPT